MIRISDNWRNPESQPLEIVERKGLGHPDTLADALADEVSRAYSLYCLDKFGAIPHHNVDKLYIGAGLFRRDYGQREMVKPIRVQINGRVSNTMNGQLIPLAYIQTSAVKRYLGYTLPHLDCENELVVECNSTTHSKVPYWFEPRDVSDLPEYNSGTLRANDTSVCVAHWPPTLGERCAFELEQSFWTQGPEGFRVPVHDHIGQDIKVMVNRVSDELDITLCIPVISTKVSSQQEYVEALRSVEEKLAIQCKSILSGTRYKGSVKVNPDNGGGYHHYLLAIGSCIDCGEEGVVGRGNTNQGVISIFREHSVEAPDGKNPVYHTGRVLGTLTAVLSRRIYEQLGSACTIVVMTKNKFPLLSPPLVNINMQKKASAEEIEALMGLVFSSDTYLQTVLDRTSVRR
ncbi:MAG: S-adenosylmethionine synthetase [Candidatus Berkelbacteria bacterium]|nr:S-adenosylmethionine synthetase [Candidatus Berkelbacteria bacterium]